MPTRANRPPAVLDDLRGRLAAAVDHRGASEAAVTALADAARGLKPSVYLERSGRLRCQAARTYSQVFDGMPPSAGVIGRTFSTGTTTVVTDVSSSGDYLEIAAEVVAQVCVPLRIDGRVVGVVNAEAHEPLEDDVVALVEATAISLQARLAQVGGALLETPAQRLVRYAAQLTAAHDGDRLQHELLGAAIGVSGLDSAALVVRADDGRSTVAAARGPLAGLLGTSPIAELDRAAIYVEAGCSCVTVVDETAAAPEVLPTVRSRGAASAAVFGLTDEPPRMLLVASGEQQTIPTETVELLELLCAQAKSVWRSCDLLADLRRQAATDPLTGLAHHGAFYERLQGTPCGGVAMLDLDHFKAFNDARGHPDGDALLRNVAAILRAHTRAGDELFRVGGDEFAILVAPAARSTLAQIAARVEAAVRAQTDATISIGVALDHAGDALAHTRKRADSALYAAKHDGRGRIVVV